jgi:hypothetical protein
MARPPFTRIEVPPEARDEAVRQLRAGCPVTEVAKGLGICVDTLRRRYPEWGLQDLLDAARAKSAQVARNPAAAPAKRKKRRIKRKPPEALTPAAVAARISEAVDRQLEAVEQILLGLQPGELGEAERGARTLAALARTLADLSKIKPGGARTDAGDHEPAAPRNLDELRRALLERLDQAVADQSRAVSGEPAG